MAVNQTLESLAFQQLHGNEMAATVFTNLIDRTDVGMVQRGSGARFPLKTVERERIFFRLGGQEFERDMPAQVDVFCLIHNAHPPAAELRKDAVVRHGLADHLQKILLGMSPQW
jgi:hypothetical protein